MSKTANARSADPQDRGDNSIVGPMKSSNRRRENGACNVGLDKGASAMLAILATDDLKSVRELERLRIEATRQNDADMLAPLLHEQLIYINSAGAVFDKDHYLRSIRSHSLTHDRDFDVRETEARVLDDVIILAGVMLGHSRLDGEQQVFHFPCIGVWRKDSDQWRMLAGQSSSGSIAP